MKHRLHIIGSSKTSVFFRCSKCEVLFVFTKMDIQGAMKTIPVFAHRYFLKCRGYKFVPKKIEHNHRFLSFCTKKCPAYYG